MTQSVELELFSEPGGWACRQLPLPASIGRALESDLVLKHWRVAKQHVRLIGVGTELFIEEGGSLAGTLLNGERLSGTRALKSGDTVDIAVFQLRFKRWHVHADTAPASEQQLRAAAADTESRAWQQRLHAALLARLELRRRDVTRMSDEALRATTAELLDQLLDDYAAELPAGLDVSALKEAVVNEAIGLGPLETLLNDESITEIMVNRHDQIYVERGGKLARIGAMFSNDQAVMSVIERIVTPLGRRIDESVPMVDARLLDGSRVHAIIPPLALKGPTLTIRKFPRRRLDAGALLASGSWNESIQQFLAHAVERKLNIVVSGGTGTGKTTLLNVLSNFIPAQERVITIEDAAELKLNHDHLVTLEARPANLEGRGAITIRDLLRNALRMRPDRIVIGECRGGEALDMLQAMNTGHEGSLTTLHANSPRDALARLEILVLMAGMSLPLAAIREQIASTIDLVVQIGRFQDGSRRITAVAEVSGIESGRIQVQPLFSWSAAAGFQGCGLMPSVSRNGPLQADPAWFAASSLREDAWRA